MVKMFTELKAKHVVLLVLILFFCNWILLNLVLKTASPLQLAFFDRQLKYAEKLLLNPFFVVVDGMAVGIAMIWVIKNRQEDARQSLRMLVLAMLSGNLAGY